MENRLVSIITPTYNSAEYIAETIESIIRQTYPNWELLITDDCSSDHTVEIIKQHAGKDSRIKWFQLHQNSGAATARNNSIKNAKGRFIAFCDSDDLWLPQKLERQLNFMQEKDAAISYTAIEMIDENGVLLKEKRNVKECIDYKFLLKNTLINTSSALVDKTKTGDFTMPLLRSYQDYALWLQLMRSGTKAFGINQVFVQYRVRKNSLSSGKHKGIKKVYHIQRKLEKINVLPASLNTLFYVLNAVKKYYF